MHRQIGGRLGAFLVLAVAMGAGPSVADETGGSQAGAPKPIWVNFELKGSKTPCGYVADVGRTFDQRHGHRFGWNVDHTDVTRDRGLKKNQLRDTLSHFHEGGVWEIEVEDGWHDVHVSIGDAGYESTHQLYVEGVPFWEDKELEANDFRRVRRSVLVWDGRLTLHQGNAGEKATRINYIKIDTGSEQPRCDDEKDGDGGGGDDSVGTTTEGGGKIGARPYGLKGLKKTFGKRCNKRTNDARTYYPSAGGRGKRGYVYYHSKLAGKVGGKVLGALERRGKTGAVDYGVWGYACRLKTGGTSWSVHSWGAAIDTNTLRNPYGARKWDGRGSNRKRYGRLYPEIWMGQGFYWGLNFSDPMHFQYVEGY